MKRLSKILVFVLAAALICTAFMFAVSADTGKANTVSYTAGGAAATGDLATAIANADAETTITLQGDCTTSSAITVSKNVTVDLGGYTLNSSAQVLFEVSGDVTFKVTGTGTINVNGMVFRTASGKAPNVSIIGTQNTAGIDINHTGSSSQYITYTYTGTFLYQNLDILTTHAGWSTDKEAFIHNYPNASAAATYVTLKSVEFQAPNVAPKNPGACMVSCAGKDSKLTISDSGLYTTGSGINLSYCVGSTGDTIIAEINNSVISAVSDYRAGAGSRNFGLWLDLVGNADDAHSQANGTVKMSNSTLEASYRVMYANWTNADITLNATNNSIIRNVGMNSTGDNSELITRYVAVNLDSTSKLSVLRTGISHDAANPVKASVGTRVSSLYATKSATGVLFPDGKYASTSNAYKWVYDPAGDPEFPYVLCNASDNSITIPDYFVNYTFENIFIKGGDLDYALTIANTNTSYEDGESFKTAITAAGMQHDIKMGTLSLGQTNGNAYIRYTVTNNASGTYTNTLSEDGKSLNSTADPYVILGGAANPDYNKAMFESADIDSDGENDFERAKVAVLNFDFGTDSDKGYPQIGVTTQSRFGKQTGSGSSRSISAFQVRNDGTVSSSLKGATGVTVSLNPAGQWNHLTVVFYTDTNLGTAHYFLNGNYIGYTDIRLATDAYLHIMGVRVNIEKTWQIIGSSLCYDNVSFKAYREYQKGESDGATSSTTAAKYVTSKSANKFINSDYGYTVSGILSNVSLNEAIADATAKGTAVDLMEDVKGSQTVTTDGVVSTHGYEIESINTDSYGYVKDDACYTFNKDYWYNVKWYIGELGNAEQMADDNYYLTEAVKLGFEFDKVAIHTEAIKDLANLTVNTQQGWAYAYPSELSVTPLTPAMAEYNAYKTNGAKMYPAVYALPMNYYVLGADGKATAGGRTNADATADFRAMKSGDTFVLQSNIVLEEAEFKFATDGAAQVFNIDLGGNTLAKSVEGTFIMVGNNTTVNVYSSAAGGQFISTFYNGSALSANSNTAFMIDDGSSVEGTSNAAMAATRANVNNAKINIGTVTVGGNTYDGANMTVVANNAIYGYKGGENCAVTSIGVDYISPGGVCCVFDARVYDGDVIVKDAVVFAPNKMNIVNLDSFSVDDTTTADNESHKNKGIRAEGFENFIITSYMELENVFIINDGLTKDGSRNIVSNNGDTTDKIEGGLNHVALKMKNVVTTGRFNPSNEGHRTLTEGLTLAEIHAHRNNASGTGTVNATYGAGMHWQLLDLGIEGDVVNFVIPAYDANGEVKTIGTYNIASYNADTTGLADVYKLPETLDALATVYEADAVKVTWAGLGNNADTKVEYYVEGGKYVAITAPNAAEAKLNAVKLTKDGTWTGIPAAGTVITEDVTVTPGYTVSHNIAGVTTNLSIYSDFGLNLFIPKAYAEYITVTVGEAVVEPVLVDTDGDGDADSLRYTERVGVSAVNSNVAFKIAIAEGDYTASATATLNIVTYADKILKNEGAEAADKQLMYYMLVYANEAIEYFGTAKDSAISAITEAYTGEKIAEQTYSNVITNMGLAPVFEEATIQLESSPNFVFKLAGGFAGTVTVSDGINVREFENITADDKGYLIYTDMRAYNFASNLTITAVGTYNGEEVNLKGFYNLDTFVDYHVDNEATNEESAKCLPLLKAFYDYVVVANDYKA